MDTRSVRTGFLSLLAASLLLLGSAGRAAAVDVLTCGDEIPDGAVGDLVGDIECGDFDLGIRLGKRSVLRLNGFEIRGRQGAFAVHCMRRSCTVLGPGRITAAEIAIFLHDYVRLNVADLEIDGNDSGIIGEQGTAISGGNSTIRATGIAVRNSESLAVNTGSFIGRDVVLEGNGDRGIWARIIRGEGFTVIGNGEHGLDARRRISIRDLTATGNAGAGVHSEGSVSLRDSVVVDNGALDVIAERARLKNTQCGTSNLGVCAND